MGTLRAKAKNGLDHYTCDCGDHSFAYPQHDEMQEWKKYRVTHPVIREILRKKGALVDHPPPPPLPHVILLSPEDAALFEVRRWRVFEASKGSAKKYEVKRKPRTTALHRFVMPEAKTLRFVNGDGCDCRRGNVRTYKGVQVAHSTTQKPVE